MNFNKILLILSLFALSSSVFGQDPFHFIIGENEFSAVDIYDIEQTDDGIYWIASNNGIYSFDGYDFNKYQNSKTLSNSFFNLVSDYSGSIHFNNLNGQIFKIQNEAMELVHSVPDSLLIPYLNFDFLPNNDLVVHSSRCYKIDSSGIRMLIEQSPKHKYLTGFSRDYQGNLTLQYTRHTLYNISEKEVSKIQLSYSKNEQINIGDNLTFLFHEKGLFIVDNGESLLYISDSSENKINLKRTFSSEGDLTRIYTTGENFWVANNKSGVRIYDIPESSYQNIEKVAPLKFKNHFVSNVFEDRSGNILIGTFGDGIVVVPNTGVTNILLPEALKISRICSNQSEGLFLGGFNGNIYELTNDSLSLLYNEGVKLVETLYYMDDEEQLFFDQKQPILFDINNKTEKRMELGSVKDIAKVSVGSYAVATNMRAIKLTTNKGHTAIEEKLFNGRTYAIEYHPDLKSFFIATSKGLVVIDSTREEIKLSHEGSTIMARDLEYHNGTMYLGTKEFGVLQFRKGQLYSFANINTGLLSNTVEQLHISDQFVYVATDRGFQVFKKTGELIKILSNSDGLKSVKIRDFVVDDNYLWVLHKHGIQRLNLLDINSISDEYNTNIDKVEMLINDQKTVSLPNLTLEHTQNRVKFIISAPSLERKEDISYEFRLTGIDNEWNSNDYLDNVIEYKSLPPGTYSFQVNLMYKKELQDTFQASFKISKPIWQEWWFISSGLLILLLIVIFYFNNKLKQQELKTQQINELNLSKLTAIRSQMNPHFIFNALNSIQEFIIINEKKMAASFLGKFADLMRKYLDHSQVKTVSVSEEIETLTLYLELEKLRFEDLSYTIEIESKLDTELNSIPTLIIQPYVENALKHGLLHKSGAKNIRISFSINPEHDIIDCNIEDNGIGRINSVKINNIRSEGHISFASKATKSRLELLNFGNNKPLGETITDLYDKNGNPSGTHVHLAIPLLM